MRKLWLEFILIPITCMFLFSTVVFAEDYQSEYKKEMREYGFKPTKWCQNIIDRNHLIAFQGAILYDTKGKKEFLAVEYVSSFYYTWYYNRDPKPGGYEPEFEILAGIRYSYETKKAVLFVIKHGEGFLQFPLNEIGKPKHVSGDVQEKLNFVIDIPHFITEEYLKKSDPDECLVPLDFIALPGAQFAIVPFVTVAEKRFMEKEGVVSKRFEIKLEMLIRIDREYIGNRLLYVNALEDGIMQRIWTNPEGVDEHINPFEFNVV